MISYNDSGKREHFRHEMRKVAYKRWIFLCFMPTVKWK